MVVTRLPATLFIVVVQARVACPSTCTVQAPQSAIPQPNLVPVSPSTSRSTHSSGISGATSTCRDVPFTINVIIAIALVSHEVLRVLFIFLADEFEQFGVDLQGQLRDDRPGPRVH